MGLANHDPGSLSAHGRMIRRQDIARVLSNNKRNPDGSAGGYYNNPYHN